MDNFGLKSLKPLEATEMAFFLSKFETSSSQSASIFWLIEHSPGLADLSVSLEMKSMRNPVPTISKIQIW
jgi:hypothetical protein